MITEFNNFLQHTNRRMKRKKKKQLCRKKREAARTWTAGKLITFVSFDIFGKEHRFLCQMRKLNKFYHEHRCAQCKAYNHYRVCMYLGGETMKRCMRKSDLSCYPHKLRILK